MRKFKSKNNHPPRLVMTLGTAFLFTMIASGPATAKGNVAGQSLIDANPEMYLAAVVDPQKALFDTLRKAGKTYSFIAGELKKEIQDEPNGHRQAF